jgi:hypothetical protein
MKSLKDKFSNKLHRKKSDGLQDYCTLPLQEGDDEEFGLELGLGGLTGLINTELDVNDDENTVFSRML